MSDRECCLVAVRAAFDERQSTLTEHFRAISCSGSTVFERLPYYRCATSIPTHKIHVAFHVCNAKVRTARRYHLFWAFHVAHALIYGVVAVLWRFLLRQPKDAGSGGAAASHIILTTSARQEMSRRVQPGILKSTGCISGKIPDVTKCVFPEQWNTLNSSISWPCIRAAV
jgi:hypothetical protein